MLLDYGMPGMTGADVLAEKAKDSSIAEIPVLLMTGCRRERLNIEGGIVALISKGGLTEVWLAMVNEPCKP